MDEIQSRPDEEGQVDRMMAFAGTLDGLPPRLSEEVDAVLYGPTAC